MASARRFCWPNDMRQRRPLADVLEVGERRPAQRIVHELVERRRGRDRGSSGRTATPPGPSARTASGWGSGRRSRTSSTSSAVRLPAMDAPSTRIGPTGDVEQPHGRPEQRRLAGAVRTEHGDGLGRAEARRRRRAGSRVSPIGRGDAAVLEPRRGIGRASPGARRASCGGADVIRLNPRRRASRRRRMAA